MVIVVDNQIATDYEYMYTLSNDEAYSRSEWHIPHKHKAITPVIGGTRIIVGVNTICADCRLSIRKCMEIVRKVIKTDYGKDITIEYYEQQQREADHDHRPTKRQVRDADREIKRLVRAGHR